MPGGRIVFFHLQELWRTSWPPGHPVRDKSFNLSPRDMEPSPLNSVQVWHFDLCVTLGVQLTPQLSYKVDKVRTSRGTSAGPWPAAGLERGSQDYTSQVWAKYFKITETKNQLIQNLFFSFWNIDNSKLTMTMCMDFMYKNEEQMVRAMSVILGTSQSAPFLFLNILLDWL